MRPILLVVGLLLLVACKPIVVEKAPLPVILPPLEVSLTADQTTAELELVTTLHCTASGSDGNYSYKWFDPRCSGAQCAITLKTIGNFSFSCDVSSNNSTKSAAVVLQVTKRDKPIHNVYVFGDSLSYGHGLADPGTESWPVLYARTFENAALHNYAVTGADTQGVLHAQLSMWHNQTNESCDGLVFVWIGANDIQHLILPQQFEQNYKQILDRLADCSDVVLMDIPDVSRLNVATDVEEGINAFIQQVGFNVSVDVKGISKDIIIQYNDIIRAEGAARKLPVIDMFDFMSTIPDSILGSDRVHPNKEGHVLVANKVRSDVITFYPDDELR